MTPSPRRRKRCRFCKELFLPDPRPGARQYACAKPSCQKERKHRNQKTWLKRRPGYFKGRYPNTRKWLQAHPGYLQQYRRKHPQALQRDNIYRKIRHREAQKRRADIQVALSLQRPIRQTLTSSLFPHSNADIQDPFWRQVIIISLFSAAYLARARADIQDPIAFASSSPYPYLHDYETCPDPTAYP